MFSNESRWLEKHFLKLSVRSMRRHEIDKLDRKILSILQRDSRKSYLEMARQLKLSETAIRSRVKKLMENGVIKKFTTIIDWEKVGKTTQAFICLNIGGEMGPAVGSQLVGIDEITDIYTVTGDIDLILKVICENTSHLERIIEKLRSYDFTDRTVTYVVLRKVKENGEVTL
jgi:Lrp/AsnC family transcriptional regulator for asnA, asnC and gidA